MGTATIIFLRLMGTATIIFLRARDISVAQLNVFTEICKVDLCKFHIHIQRRIILNII